ncbi:MAG: AAA family ATPase [Hungatella sp.]|nr:AAA family ATPase [Hungatella sp.]
MMKRKMILADSDDLFLKEISCYFMEHIPQFELTVFTKKEKLHQYLEQGGKADILLVDQCFGDTKLKMLTPDTTRIVMSMGAAPAEGFDTVKKYQKMESLANTVLFKYAEANNAPEMVRGNSNTRIAAFYSPAGGTGKTTLALALAMTAAMAGVRVMYLNLEEIDSVNDVLERTSGSLSDIFLALKTRGMNAGIKVKGAIRTESQAGFDYISGVESVSEYEELNGKEIGELLNIIRELADYDLVVVDQSSGFTDKTRAVLAEADTVMVPVVMDEGSVSKLVRLLEESALHDMYDSLIHKMNIIINKAEPHKKPAVLLPDTAGSRLPLCATVMLFPAMERKRTMLQAKEAIAQLMGPVFQAVMGGAVEQ